MSLSYAESKILEAYKLSKGNKTKVNQVINVLAEQDTKLLKALTAQYMRGIIAAHVDRVLARKSNQSTNTTHVKPANFKTMATQPADEQTEESDDFGMEILKAASGESAEVFGFDSGAPIKPPQQASQAHIDAIHQMAARAKSRFNK